jgi:hypothetical protein
MPWLDQLKLPEQESVRAATTSPEMEYALPNKRP